MTRPNEFSSSTKLAALIRQKNVCACCGDRISHLGDSGRSTHRFGEGARAHHINHVKLQGSSNVNNCVILCQSCHYSVHEGGNYRFGTAIGRQSDFECFNGKPWSTGSKVRRKS